MSLMSQWCAKYRVEIWCCCLMPNHVHLIVTPDAAVGLGRAIGEAHRRYTRMINLREGWRGYLWQGRFASFPMDERHLLAASRYVELNPVRARLVARAEAYVWSSARAHVTGRDDGLVKVSPLLALVSDWQAFLASGKEQLFDAVRKHERSGRPLGGEDFEQKISQLVGRDLRRKKPGRKRIKK